MKKTSITAIIFILIGYTIGNYMFNNKEIIDYKKDTYYILQEGVYSDAENLQNNLKHLSMKAIDYSNNRYYVYVGITRDLEVLEILKNIYAKKNIKVYQREKNIKSEEFLQNVTQFDMLIKAAKEDDEILTIEEVVLANYEEIIKK